MEFARQRDITFLDGNINILEFLNIFVCTQNLKKTKLCILFLLYVYLRKPQTAHESFFYGCPFTVVKDVLLYLQADYRKTCSFSLLFPSSLPKNMETETEPRSYEVTPDLSLDASMYVDVCGCVSM